MVRKTQMRTKILKNGALYLTLNSIAPCGKLRKSRLSARMSENWRRGFKRGIHVIFFYIINRAEKTNILSAKMIVWNYLY